MAAPEFIVRDTAAIVSEMVADLEGRTSKTLYPGQPERLLINFMAYRESLLRSQVQDAALLNLVRHSRGVILDELAVDRGMERLPAFAAGCLLEFRLPAVQKTAVTIPADTVVSTSDGAVSVSTLSDLVIPAGALSGVVKASAVEPGSAGNGYVAGQINQLVSVLPVPVLLAVSNTTTTDGGSDGETDDRLKQRLLLAFDQYSVAGPAPAYRLMAMNQHPDVIDVAVCSHEPGVVTLYPLTSTGPAGPTVLAAVQSGVSADEVRVLCDTVEAAPPVELGYTVRGRLTLNRGDAESNVLPEAIKVVRALAGGMAGALGGEIVPSQFVGALQALVHRVELDEPAFAAGDKWHWRHCTAIELTIAGSA